MQQEYSIAELKPGMYVDEVLSQSGTLKVKSKGLVRTKQAIAALARQGVETVLVDLDKSQMEQESTIEDLDEQPIESPKPAKKTPIDKELKKASKLYKQAKTLQDQAFESMKAGKPIDTGAMKEVADGFIDSVFRNADALACMTRMREKDEYLMEHSVNVSIIMTIFAKHLRLERPIIHDLATGALLHDVGKIGVPDPILNKPGRLTDGEMDQMRSHVTLGYNVLKKSGDLNPISIEVVGDHHERLDGMGYPNGKNAEQLSQYARMIAIVDTYDAITASRCYQNARSPVTAFKILRGESGSAFDANLVAEFIKCMGIHPVGTLVKMKSNKLGIVTESNLVNPICPVVHVFYSISNKSYIDPRTMNLADKNVSDEIERSVKPEDFKIDMMKYFREMLLG